MTFWEGLFLIAFFDLAFMFWCLFCARAADRSYKGDHDYDSSKCVREVDKYNMRNRGL